MSIPKISHVVDILRAHNGALRLDRVLEAAGIPVTPDNLHETAEWLESLEAGWLNPDEDCRLPPPKNSAGLLVALATTRAQKKFDLPQEVYQTDGNYVPFPERAAKRTRKPENERKSPEQTRFLPVVCLCSMETLLGQKSESSLRSDVLAVTSQHPYLFGEVKYVKPSTIDGFATVTLLLRIK